MPGTTLQNLIVILIQSTKFNLIKYLGKTRVLLVWGRGLIGSDKTESAVPGRCKLKNSSLILKVSKEVEHKSKIFYKATKSIS